MTTPRAGSWDQWQCFVTYTQPLVDGLSHIYSAEGFFLFITVYGQLGDKPTGRQPTGRQRLDDWATRFGQLDDKAIINPLLTTVKMGKLYNYSCLLFCLFATVSVIVSP